MDYLRGPNVITLVLTRRSQEGQSERVRDRAVMMEVEVRIMPLLNKAMNRKVRVASELEKKEQFPIKPREGAQLF